MKKIIDRALVLEFVRVTEAAAVGCYNFIGKMDSKGADGAAVKAMREELNRLAIDGTIVIGEGERDEAPMLYIGEKVGKGGVAVDIAVDPLEGTELAAKNMPNSIVAMSIGLKDTLLHAPDLYMEKIAIGPGYPQGIIDLDIKPSEIVKEVAKFKKVSASEITVCVLERDRHQAILEDLKSVGAKVNLILEGDVAAVINAADSAVSGIDLYMGIGGAPEGVLAASALKCVGGQMVGRLQFKNQAQIDRAKTMGIDNPNRKYSVNDMVKDDCMFVMTGVTHGNLVKGISYHGSYFMTESLVMRSETRTVRKILTKHYNKASQ